MKHEEINILKELSKPLEGRKIKISLTGVLMGKYNRYIKFNLTTQEIQKMEYNPELDREYLRVETIEKIMDQVKRVNAGQPIDEENFEMTDETLECKMPTMTVKERIEKALENREMETDSIDKIIALAYYLGREQAAKEVCNSAKQIFTEQQKRAAESRYHNFAMAIQGNINYIYHPDYAGDMTAEFGSDRTVI
jgi:hypothetical protein